MTLALKGTECSVSFTTVESIDRLTKSVSVDGTGRIKKQNSVSLYKGTATRSELSGMPDAILKQLGAHLASLSSNQAIICAPPADCRAKCKIVTEKEYSNNSDEITRTDKFFADPSGPALLVLDIDAKEFDAAFNAKIGSHEEIPNILAMIYPPFETASMMVRASSGSGIVLDGGEPTSSGYHLYFVVSDGQKIGEFVGALADRLMLAGYLWHYIAKTGTPLERTLFDVAASSGKARLVYEADAVLNDDRLGHKSSVREPSCRPGGLLDIAAMLPLSSEERERLAEIKEAAMERAKTSSKAIEARQAYETKRVAELVKRGTAPDVARKLVTKAVDVHQLSGDFIIELDEFGPTEVREILRNPKQYNRATCADPNEPEYGSGRNVAIVYTDGAHGCHISSQAHGGIKYLLPDEPSAWFEVIEKQPSEDEGDGDHQHVAGTASTTWPEPFDIFDDESPVNLGTPPEGSLPEPLLSWATSEARRKGVSVASAAASGLTVVASAIGTSLKLSPRLKDDGWAEPCCLWTALVAEPGAGKSPIISAATQPIQAFDELRGNVGEALHAAWQAEQKRKPKGAPDRPEPKITRILVDAVTPEKQIQVHADNPRGLLRSPDELMSMLGDFGAYKKSGEGDRSQFLRLFEGRPITVDRIGRGTTRAKTALMSTIAGTQPEKIKMLVKDLSADGVLQRFIFIMDDGVERPDLDEAPDAEAIKGYYEMVRHFAETTYSTSNPIKLAPAAYKQFNAALADIKALANLPGASSAWRGHIAKWPKFLTRITLAFHAIAQWNGPLEGVVPELPVEESTVRMAVKFARFLLLHSLKFYETFFGKSEKGSEAVWIAGHILAKPDLAHITRKTLYDARKLYRDDAGLLKSAMAELDTAQWVRIVSSDASGPNKWAINPKVHQRFAERAAWEKTDRETRQRKLIAAATAKKALISEDKLSLEDENDQKY